ncbi:pseudouridine synthase [Pisolithus orientalis]|uniref:pseudouridine synthase n=1 Tax=Pisolithus orientalis TaxID=936130 RepID=UPI00222419A3|nr:pseudouridine synthase [Pisolithus orientalis]KAI5999364.1 pseudouridine synthase [Pisolithus orientalis]
MRYTRWICPLSFPSFRVNHRHVDLHSRFIVKIMSGSESAHRHISLSPPPAKRSPPETSVDVPLKRVKSTHDATAADDDGNIAGQTDTPSLSFDQKVAEDGNAEPRRGKRDAAGYPKSRKGKSKDKRNVGPRRRGTRSERTQQQADDDNNDDAASPQAVEQEGQKIKPLRLPKRQTALLLGFCGTGCSGMQIQPNLRTIEGVLFDALVRAGAVSQDNADDPVKVGLGRAARTDAGVHAAGNLVSMKLITTIPGIKDWIGHVNSFLPPEIRVWGKVRVQNSFNARTSCDSRKYTYFFPTYLLIPPKPNTALARTLQSSGPLSTAQDASTEPSPSNRPHVFWDIPNAESTTPEEDLKFEGTHNFHNLTVGREYGDRSNQRHMIRIEVSDPAVYGDTEWISVLFHGQSFMLHQRKMMSALVLSCRTGTPSRIIDELYGPRMVMVPKMPALGLLLEYPIFETYNKRISANNEKLDDPSDADYRPEIDFEVHRKEIDDFKQKYIYDNMRNTEDQCGIFDAWIRYVDSYEGNDLTYLNQRGIIPSTAVIKKGIKRPRPFKEKKRFDITSLADIKQEGALIIGDEAADEENEEEGLSKGKLDEMEG